VQRLHALAVGGGKTRAKAAPYPSNEPVKIATSTCCSPWNQARVFWTNAVAFLVVTVIPNF
jgi:hypothetical protein